MAAPNRLNRRQFVIGSALFAGAGLLSQTQAAGAQTLLQAPAVAAQQKMLSLATLDGELSDGVTAQLPALESKTGIKVDLVKLPGAEVWRMSGGKAKRVQSLSDTAELKKALGG